MKAWLTASLMAAMTVAGSAQAPPAENAKETRELEALPPVEDAIPPPVKAVAEPKITPFPGGIRMAVTAATAEAQAHVNLGLNHLHGGWEFEASRHFAAAMRRDPECLLAHWGMVMTLLSPSPETGPARNAASDRLLHLVDKGAGSELERGYAYGLIKYMEGGPAAAATAFQKVAETFPNDMQATIFAALFGRGGYDEFGHAKAEQETAEAALEALIKKHPQSVLPLHALLSIRAEAPELGKSLPLARQLCEMAPDYPLYFHLLGHYEWRSGEHAKAAAAFGRATTLLDEWMAENDVSHPDAPEWVKAECYRIASMVSKGDFEDAYAAARKVAALEFPAERNASPGARLLMWEAWTLPARVLMHRGLRGNVAEALASLPSPEKTKAIRDHSLSHWWVDGLRFALDAQHHLEAGKLEEARASAEVMTHHGKAMAQTQQKASIGGERSAWNRAFRALEVIASDLRGRIALAGPPSHRGSAFNWFRSAADRQTHSTLLFPPAVLTPMAARLGDLYLTEKKPAEAIDAFKEALNDYPNDRQALAGLKTAYAAAKMPTEAAAIEKQIEALGK